MIPSPSWNSTKAETLSLACMKSKGLSLETNALLYLRDGELESGEVISLLPLEAIYVKTNLTFLNLRFFIPALTCMFAAILGFY